MRWQPKDISGKRYGKLIVLDWVQNVKQILKPSGNLGWTGRWRCQCDCGNEVLKPTSALNGGLAKSCGCLLRHRTESLVGRKFGKLTVAFQKKDTKRDIKRKKSRRRRKFSHSRKWLCVCECGTSVVVNTYYLKSGRKTHCGCSPIIPDMTVRDQRLKEFRAQFRRDTFKKFCDRLMALGNLQVLTTLEDYLSKSKNCTLMKIHVRCPQGHEVRATWPNFVRDAECRECRRLAKLRAIHAESKEARDVRLAGRRLNKVRIQEDRLHRKEEIKYLEWLKQQEMIRNFRQTPEGVEVQLNPAVPKQIIHRDTELILPIGQRDV